LSLIFSVGGFHVLLFEFLPLAQANDAVALLKIRQAIVDRFRKKGSALGSFC
jgi:hypothetical protein